MRIFVGGMVAVLAIAVIGCGSGGDTTEVALTKAQFIKRGDAICRAAQAKKTEAVNAWLKENVKGENVEEASIEELSHLYLTVALPPIKEASDELAALTPPAGDTKAEKIVEFLATAVKEIEEKPTRAINHEPYVNLDHLAQPYGFEVCDLF